MLTPVEYALKLRGAPAFPLKSWGNLAVEVAACLAGVKPVIQTWILEPDLSYADALCKTLGWRRLEHERQASGPPPARVGLMLGKDRKRLAAAASAWSRADHNPGVALGYPRCCATFYWDCDPAKGAASGVDIIHKIRENTPRPGGPLPFLLNDCFYLFSRRWAPEDAGKRDALAAKNAGLDLNALNAVPWHSCSYRCPVGLARARKAWAFMKASVPALADVIERHLKGPVLFWHWDRFAALDAVKAGPDRWKVRGLRPPYALLEPAEDAALRAGGELTRRGRAWRLRRGGRTVWSAPGELPFLLDFR